MVTTAPRIYVACLAAYNAGILHGRWIDLEGKDGDDIRAEVEAMLAASPIPDAEEWRIDDHEGLGRNPPTDFDDLAEYVEMIDDLGEAVIRYHENGCGPLSDFEDAYLGEWDSLADYAASLVEDAHADELKALPDFIRYNIDWDGIGRDMEMNGDIWTADAPGGKVYVFRNV